VAESDADTDTDADSDADVDTDTDVVVDTGASMPLVTADTARIHSADTGTYATSDSGASTSDSGCDQGYDDVMFCGYNCSPGAACIGCLATADCDSDSASEVFIEYFCYPCGSQC
jgi:hypothetical protein